MIEIDDLSSRDRNRSCSPLSRRSLGRIFPPPLWFTEQFTRTESRLQIRGNPRRTICKENAVQPPQSGKAEHLPVPDQPARSMACELFTDGGLGLPSEFLRDSVEPLDSWEARMPGITITRTDYMAQDLRRAAAGSHDANAAMRMLALAFCDGRKVAERSGFVVRDGPADVARLGASNNIVGLDGLVDRKAPGAAPRLSSSQMREVAELVRQRPRSDCPRRGALASDRPVASDRTALRRHARRALGGRPAAAARVPADVGAAALSRAGRCGPGGA